MLGWLFGRGASDNDYQPETRAAGSGFTAEVMQAREAYIAGRQGIAELSATAQSCVSLWEHGLSQADVEGTTLLDRRTLAVIGRSLALRGESVHLIRETGLIPCSDWDLRTRDGRPSAYRVTVPEAGGGRSETALAGEVLHIRIGVDPAAPYLGSAPLRRSSLSAGLLQAVEAALGEVYESAPLGTSVLPFPESPDQDMESLGRGFRGKRGRVLLRESVNVQAAGGPAPTTDWRPSDMSPDLSKTMSVETLRAAREAVTMAFGVVPAFLNSASTGPVFREAQRHLVAYQLQPIASVIAEEMADKTLAPVSLDLGRPLQAYDTAGRARAMTAIVGAMATAKAQGLSDAEVATAARLVGWGDETAA